MQNIYQVLGDCIILSTDDLDEEDRLRINSFFKENYGFCFKDVCSKAFETQLQNAIYNSNNPVDIIIVMARRALKGRNKSSWQEVIDYEL